MVSLLSQLRKNCAELEYLDIADNFVKDEATNELGELIVECKHLRVLNISDCNITEEQNNIIVAAF